jgi:SAM-dependent methyltransferase
VQLRSQQADWDHLAELDPYWAILSDSNKRFGGWDRGEFLESGKAPVRALMEKAAVLGHPVRRHAALDFGCGVGRLTRALAEHFEQCVGVDISEQMITEARRLNADIPNCTFTVNVEDSLPYGNGEFDLVFTKLVLQHLPHREAILSYIAELSRALAPGGLLVAQVPNYLELRRRLQVRRRVYRMFRRFGLPPRLLYSTLGLHPIPMNSAPAGKVRQVLERTGGHLLRVESERAAPGVESATYYASR